MTQRIFDVENEKDYADLWDIVPEEIKTIYKDSNGFPVYFIKSPEIDGIVPSPVGLFKINWHGKTEITRPLQEATEVDIGKICVFWDNNDDKKYYSTYTRNDDEGRFMDNVDCAWDHCRRLTKQEIEELC